MMDEPPDLPDSALFGLRGKATPCSVASPPFVSAVLVREDAQPRQFKFKHHVLQICFCLSVRFHT